MNDEARRVIVTGAGLNVTRDEAAAASLLGSLLAREGYTLIAGTWGGVDEAVTRGFVGALSREAAQPRVIHIENHDKRFRSQHDVRVGKVIKSNAKEKYSREGVELAHAGVIVSGREGSKPTMDAMMAAGKPVIPLAWLGHDAFSSLQDLLRESVKSSRHTKRLFASLSDPACASDETVSRLLGAFLRPEHEIFVSYHRADSGAEAGRLAADLASLYGARRVFLDSESLPAAAHLDTITAKAAVCRVMLLLVGAEFGKRTSGENDYVRKEVTAAREGGAVLVPVLVDREFESIGPLPEKLRFLHDLNFVRLQRLHWDMTTRAIEIAVDRALHITPMRPTLL